MSITQNVEELGSATAAPPPGALWWGEPPTPACKGSGHGQATTAPRLRIVSRGSPSISPAPQNSPLHTPQLPQAQHPLSRVNRDHMDLTSRCSPPCKHPGSAPLVPALSLWHQTPHKGAQSKSTTKILARYPNIPPKVRNTSKGRSSKRDPTLAPPQPVSFWQRDVIPKPPARRAGHPSLVSAAECATQEQQELNPNEPSPCSPSSLGPCPPRAVGVSVQALHLHHHVAGDRGQRDREAPLTPGWRQESRAAHPLPAPGTQGTRPPQVQEPQMCSRC